MHRPQAKNLMIRAMFASLPLLWALADLQQTL